MRYTKLFTITILILLAACKNKQEQSYKIIPKDTMVMLLTDIHLADASVTILSQRKKLKNPEQYYLHIFKKYNITKAVFDSSVSYYSFHPKEYQKIYEDVILNLNKLESKTLAEKDTTSKSNKITKFKKVLTLNSSFENIRKGFFDNPSESIKTNTGKNAILFTYKRKKSKEVKYKIKTLVSEFKVHFKCNISMQFNKTKTYPLLVIQVKEKNKISFKSEISFKDYIAEKQEWNTVDVNSTYKLPTPIDSGDIVVFIANPYKNDFLINNYFLELFVK